MIVHYDNASTFCEVQERLGARGRVTRKEEAVTCGACLERFARIEYFRLAVGGRRAAAAAPHEGTEQIDWFGDG